MLKMLLDAQGGEQPTTKLPPIRSRMVLGARPRLISNLTPTFRSAFFMRPIVFICILSISGNPLLLKTRSRIRLNCFPPYQPSSEGIVLTNDGNAILREIDVSHPAAKSMIELSRTQDEEVGDGTTSVIILGEEKGGKRGRSSSVILESHVFFFL